jgi:hypothetical protein
VGAPSGETVLQDAHGKKEDAHQKVKDAVFCTRIERAGKLFAESWNGAGDRDRTGDIQLGKLAFYR